MGRPRKPTKSKQIAGTIRPDRENPREPEFEDGSVRPPTGLSADGRKVWKEIAPELSEIGVLKKVQEHQLVLYCEAISMANKCRKVLNRNGLTYKTRTPTGSVMHRTRPEVKILNDMMSQARQIGVQFGLTPASQPKVSARPKQEPEKKGAAKYLA